VDAIKFPFNVRTVNNQSPNSLHRRANITGQSIGNTSVPIANTQNAEYIANITIGGQTIPVMLDTGSSDLWVTGTGIQGTDTGKSATLSYAVGQASGDIYTGTLQFDNYTVENQAFLLVTNTSSFSQNINSEGYNGLIGLGPNTGSVIRKKLDSSAGDSMLFRIFEQNMTTQNFFSFLLNRNSDPGNTVTGQLTISEIVPTYENITSMPKLSVETVQTLVNENQHWQILTDKNKGIIGPDGLVINVNSIVPKAPDGQLVAVLDSGFTLPQVPRSVSDLIYGRVQGAVYDTNIQAWTIPCGQLLNISFNFGGVNIPIHPLDTVNNDFDYTDKNGNVACIGAFQPITSAFSLLGNYDMILGMGFLRNTYTLLDLGDWINSSNDRGGPFVQLLPITDVNAAHTDFVNVRLKGVDTSGDPQYNLLPISQMQHSPISEQEKKEMYQEMILSRWPEIFVGCLIFLILVVGFCIWRCCRRRRAAAAKRKSKRTSFLPRKSNDVYIALDEHGGKGPFSDSQYSIQMQDYRS